LDVGATVHAPRPADVILKQKTKNKKHGRKISWKGKKLGITTREGMFQCLIRETNGDV
jgi:hypothetical protein